MNNQVNLDRHRALIEDDPQEKDSKHVPVANTANGEKEEGEPTGAAEPRTSSAAQRPTPSALTDEPGDAATTNGSAATTPTEKDDDTDPPSSKAVAVGVIGAVVLAGTQPAAEPAKDDDERDEDDGTESAPAPVKSRSLGQRAAEIHHLIVVAKKKLAPAIATRDMQLVMEASCGVQASRRP